MITENHMVQNNDNQTDCEYKLVQEREIAHESNLLEKASYVFEGDDLKEIIEGRTRKEWLEFAFDRITNEEFVINVFGFNVSSFVASDTVNDTRDAIIDDIINEMGK